MKIKDILKCILFFVGLTISFPFLIFFWISCFLPLMLIQGIINLFARVLVNDTFLNFDMSEGAVREIIGFQIIPWRINGRIEFKYPLKLVKIKEKCVREYDPIGTSFLTMEKIHISKYIE